jgi:acyl-CoA thioester hydrolase
MRLHESQFRVYYEDTDLGGIVYYANYLRFIERGRSDFVRLYGVDQTALRRDRGLVFVVRALSAEYLQPAFFDDVLRVQTRVARFAGARIVMDQAVLRDDTVLFTASVTLVCLNDSRAVRVPPDVRAALG